MTRVKLKLSDLKVNGCYLDRYGKIRKITRVSTKNPKSHYRRLEVSTPSTPQDDVEWNAVRGFGVSRGSSYACYLLNVLVEEVPDPGPEPDMKARTAYALVQISVQGEAQSFGIFSEPKSTRLGSTPAAAPRWALIAQRSGPTYEAAVDALREFLGPEWCALFDLDPETS